MRDIRVLERKGELEDDLGGLIGKRANWLASNFQGNPLIFASLEAYPLHI